MKSLLCRMCCHGAVLLGVWCTTATAAELPAAASPGVLHLTNGSFVKGQLQDSASAEILAWQGTQFTAPFRFPMSHVHSIIYPQPAILPKPSGEFCFELSGGGVLYGSLLGVTDDLVEIDETKFGRLSIKKTHLHRFYRWATGAELIFSGPTGLKGWQEKSSESKWREEGGQIVTDQPDAQLTGEFKLPAQVVVELELSWRSRPNFAVALGVGPRPDSAGQAFRFEIIESELVVLRETKREADIATVTPLGPGEGHIHLLAYLDQQRGDLLVYSMTGARLAELHVADAKPVIGGGLTLINLQGDVRLERLRINHWNGVPPTNTVGTQPRFQQSDGTVQDGRLAGYDPQQQQLKFRSGDQDVWAPLKTIDDVLLSTADEDPAQNISRNVHVIYHDGTRLSGTLTKTSAMTIGLECPEIVQPVSAPLQDLRGVTMLMARSLSTSELPQKMELLELADTKLRGRLIDGREQSGSSCLTWQPEFSETAGPLRPGVNGRIIYKSPTPTVKVAKTVNQGRRPAPQKMLNIGNVLEGDPVAKAPPKLNPKDLKFLHLRSGDTIPCEVKSIDERGVTFETTMSDATFVSHQKIKAVELMKINTTPKLSQQKRDRLLMLPRMQRDSPPSQLICSRNGDMLRGRILGMTETKLKVEVRLDARELDRDRVAQIIWLHEDELKDDPLDPDAPQESPVQTPSTRVQVQRSDGIRLTFWADQFQGATLSGKSDVLGDCRTDLAQVDQLLIGNAIELAAANLPYQRWKMHHAVNPKFVDEETGEAEPGQDSPLVGKPAPDFKLEYLDGAKFHLAECQGQVVVLDFWATWCGPCLQVMPQIEQVVGEFQDANVRLVAVNLEESPKQITATLERHKLEVPVVLDQDGVVAHKYAATAIPQTVIIDRAGNVFRVFVGGGPDYADQLREALQQVTEAGKESGDASGTQEAAPKESSKADAPQ